MIPPKKTPRMTITALESQAAQDKARIGELEAKIAALNKCATCGSLTDDTWGGVCYRCNRVDIADEKEKRVEVLEAALREIAEDHKSTLDRGCCSAMKLEPLIESLRRAELIARKALGGKAGA